MYVLSSHGDYARETLKSCELITGKLENFGIVSFKDPMSVDDIVAQYEELYDKNKANEDSFIIIVDIPNGTPANAAKIFASRHHNVGLYTGLSLMLVLAIATGTTVDEAVKEVTEMTGDILNKKTNRERTQQKPIVASGKDSDPLVNVRIDARLIHGQVATMWTRSLDLTRIMVVDDQIVKSDVQKATLKTAVPRGVHLSILTSSGAAERLNAGKYNGQRVLLLVKTPLVLQKLLENGVKLDAVNVGNMSMTEGARQVAKSVAVTDEDLAVFTEINSHGVRLYHQMVPNDKQEDFMTLIKKGK